MNGNRFLLDTNIIIYILGGDKIISNYLSKKIFYTSIICEIELFSSKSLQSKDEHGIKNFLEEFTIISIDQPIKELAILFRKKYGNFSFFTLPAGILSVFSVSFLFGKLVYNIGDFVYSIILRLKIVGLPAVTKVSGFDLFYINTKSISLMVIFLSVLMITSMVFGRKMAEGKWGLSINMFLLFFIFSMVGPFWVLKAVYNTILSKKPAWR